MNHMDRAIVVGDFNIYVDDGEVKDTVKFLELLEQYGWMQHVKEPMHDGGHMLDLIKIDAPHCPQICAHSWWRS